MKKERLKEIGRFLIMWTIGLTLSLFLYSCSVTRIDWDSIPPEDRERIASNRFDTHIYYGGVWLENPYYVPFDRRYNPGLRVVRRLPRYVPARGRAPRVTPPRSTPRVAPAPRPAPRPAPAGNHSPAPRVRGGASSNARIAH